MSIGSATSSSKSTSTPRDSQRNDSAKSDGAKADSAKADSAKADSAKATDKVADAKTPDVKAPDAKEAARVEETRVADEAAVQAARQSALRAENQAKVDALKPARAVEAPVKAGLRDAGVTDAKLENGVKPVDASAATSPVERAAEATRLAEADRAEKLPAAEAELERATATRVEREAELGRAAPDQAPAAERAVETARAEEARARAEVDRLNTAVTDAHTRLAAETKAETARAVETTDPDARQAITDRLSAAAEVAGVEGAKTMGTAAAEAVAESRDPHSAARALGASLERSIVDGKGALFGARTAEAMHNAGVSGFRDVAGGVANGVRQVKAEYDAARANVGKHEANLARFMETHGQSLSPEQREVARQEFDAAARADRERFDAASGNLLSVAQGADALMENRGLRGIMSDRVAGISSTIRDVRGAVPDALGTRAGQQHLKDALRSAPAGALPTHLVARDQAEADRLAAPLASAVTGGQTAADRAATLGDVGKHAAQLGMPELNNAEVRQHLTTALEGRTAAEIKSGLSTFSTALKSMGKTSASAAGRFGSIVGLTAAGLNLADANGVREVAEHLAKGGHGLASAADDVVKNIMQNPDLAARFGQAATQLGRAAGVFDSINAISALGRGDYVQAGISTASAAGAVLSTLGKEGLKRVVGGWLGAGATVAQLGYDLYRSGQERQAYRDQVRGVFERLGFGPEQAEIFSRMGKNTAPVLEHLGRGQGPGGADLPASEVLERMRSLSPEQVQRFFAAQDMLTDDAGNLAPNLGGVLPMQLRRNLNDLRLSLFGAQAA